MRPVRDAWWSRLADTARTDAQKRYARGRIRALARPWDDRLSACNKQGCAVKCGCGESFRPYTCRQHLVCEACLYARTKRNAPRVRDGLAAAYHAACRGGFRMRYVVMLTLTVRHSGDLALDRERLVSGWRGLYKRMHRAGWGRFPFIGVYEVTPGEDGKGHVHAHVACVWPFRDWSLVSQWWREACPESSHINIEASHDAHSAASYVSSYLTKGVRTADFSSEMRADVLAAFYGKQSIFTSKHFWQKWDAICEQCGCEWTRTSGALTRGAFAHRSSGRLRDGRARDGCGPPQALAQADERASAGDSRGHG
jgi:hypothetical protein